MKFLNDCTKQNDSIILNSRMPGHLLGLNSTRILTGLNDLLNNNYINLMNFYKIPHAKLLQFLINNSEMLNIY